MRLMNDKLRARRNKLLQKVADFMCVMLHMAAEIEHDEAFEYWMWQALSLDYWCVEHDIWLK